VIPGFFMDYWGMPHVKTQLSPMTIAVDMANCEAAIPGDGNDIIAMTYSYDMARFIARLLESEKWEEFSVVVGDEITYNQLVKIGERVRGEFRSLPIPNASLEREINVRDLLIMIGRKFKVLYDSADKVNEGAVTVPTQPEGSGYSKEDLEEATALMDRLVIGKVFDFPAAIRSKDVEGLRLVRVEDLVKEAWDGKA
jgi:phosphoserine aminotransferase